MAEKGSLSINSENMFPIIKKWLYSDHDIFYRELISNGCDAITKLRKLGMMGDFELPDGYQGRIDVVTDPEKKTIQVTDNGIGMTADEVRQYINNIAFSGAQAFLEKYKDKGSNDQIIGHFGLGFYSAFMVAELVEIDTLSYQEGAEPVHWTCDGGSEYTMEAGTRDHFGTTITLHLSEDCLEFANYYRAGEVIKKYCSFMPTEIWLSEANTKMTQVIKESERIPSDVVIEEIEPKTSESAEGEEKKEPAEKELKIRKRPELQNEIHPLWTKTPHDCTEEEYKAFYHRTFGDYRDPLFWIHLNMDYPFHLKGILYFPKINLEYESAEGVIKLYNNQVFIADNIKEVIPEYLLVLKGVIDCPDLPLNVSRSALQNDGFAQKISDYITKKVAEKLAGMCKTDRENYEKYWDDINPFIKYGCLKDEKFLRKMTDYILFRDLDGKYHALPEALEINATDKEEEKAVDENGETVEAETVEEKKDEEKKPDRTIYYVTDLQQQSQYVRLFKENGMQAFVLSDLIDPSFIQQLEYRNEGIHFARIDAGIEDALKDDTAKDEEQAKADGEKITELVQKALGNDKLKVSLQSLRDEKVSSMLVVDEQNRRMIDMMKQYGGGMSFPGSDDQGQTLVLNEKHPLVKYLLESGQESEQNTRMICEQLYDLAQLQNAPLSAERMTGFVQRSNEIMMLLAGIAQEDAEAPAEEDA